LTIDTINLADFIKGAYENALAERGHVNVLVVGKTGTGKSTLVNTVFSDRIAETGQGRPITQHMRRYSKDGSPVSIYDTRGLEVADYKSILGDLKAKVREINRSERAEDHIHVAWLCIAEGARRVEEAELELAAVLDALSVPVVVVITTAVSDQGFRNEVRDNFHSVSNVVRVNSEPFVMDEGSVMPVKGIDVLVDATLEVVPKGHKAAFAAAQRIKVDHKVAHSRIAVGSAATLAMGAGAVPIPFADAAAIVPIQIGMIASISAIFGLDMTTGFLTTLVTSSLGATGGTLGGRALVGGLLKLIPGAGSLAGGVISAGVAGTLTTALGEAYIAVLKKLVTDNPDRPLTAEEIASALKEKLKRASAQPAISA
jgi:uncharacterized protein (DUF697 family)/GTP-binding protein EngB required for normal cell division